MSAEGEARRYHRTVETAWSRARHRPAMLSPREFEIVEGWRRRGIPARVVLEVLEGRARRGAAARSLAYLASEIEEAWSAVSAGRSAEPPPHRAVHALGPREAWAAAISRWREHAPLHGILERLILEFENGATPSQIDAQLDEALAGAAPRGIVDDAERATLAALASYRGRMPHVEFQRTFARACADRLRDALGIPRLAGTVHVG